ncbi:MAG: crotonase/enoyl-CoA hydratase family protein [Methylocystis sp.]|nr:crotonase/enoyl-CoA hydratase family protein [Methylocystis sp.]MCA3583626.1 crotonase/enoyl-CoA hydratase family protein [Methylocystis sp.]MCA3593287.1 crotonase/enoyl-CoA hydratase family protein [Methylocystis sp.]
MTGHVELSRRGGVLAIRMNRPDKKNALTAAMYGAMAEALLAANGDNAVGAILFLGVPGVFSAGNDLKDFAGFAASGNLGQEVLAFLRALVIAEKPLLAAVDGLAVGVGTTMLMHCDHVLVSERAKLSTPFVNLALVPEAASSLLAPRIMGHARAFELLVMGRPFGPEQAVAAGLANAVVASDQIEAAGFAAAAEIAAKPREAVRLSRQLIKGSPDALLERIDEEALMFANRLRSAEAQKAFMAFLNKTG